MPKPKLITPELAQTLIKLRAHGATVEQACALCGIAVSTYHKYGQAQPVFRQMIIDLRGSLRYAAEMVVRDAIVDDKSVPVSQWFLRHRHSDVYNTKGDQPERPETAGQTMLQALQQVKKDELQQAADPLE